eukprot:gnl/Chilomastix_cuspidata/4056.p1 GENE.gnl/Chilomastix_cuspidata/4056~~gnl/Chilomastix_cuspidata/4056.p1  ORF type:complete len:661 (-),score=225.85 gnl/Chilomastix_cuspidata/4056:411-2393(-)
MWTKWVRAQTHQSSGKSTVIEAIGLALGHQSQRGSPFRVGPDGTRAEKIVVQLTLRKAKGERSSFAAPGRTLPVELQLMADRGRRWRVGQRVRTVKEVTSIFSDLRVSLEGSLAVVAQHEAAHMAEASPAELGAAVEHASGARAFKDAKTSAERELARVEGEIGKIRRNITILSEETRALGPRVRAEAVDLVRALELRAEAETLQAEAAALVEAERREAARIANERRLMRLAAAEGEFVRVAPTLPTRDVAEERRIRRLQSSFDAALRRVPSGWRRTALPAPLGAFVRVCEPESALRWAAALSRFVSHGRLSTLLAVTAPEAAALARERRARVWALDRLPAPKPQPVAPGAVDLHAIVTVKLPRGVRGAEKVHARLLAGLPRTGVETDDDARQLLERGLPSVTREGAIYSPGRVEGGAARPDDTIQALCAISQPPPELPVVDDSRRQELLRAVYHARSRGARDEVPRVEGLRAQIEKLEQKVAALRPKRPVAISPRLSELAGVSLSMPRAQVLSGLRAALAVQDTRPHAAFEAQLTQLQQAAMTLRDDIARHTLQVKEATRAAAESLRSTFQRFTQHCIPALGAALDFDLDRGEAAVVVEGARSIRGLSGGQRSLLGVCLALSAAACSHSQVVLLDEIDAALDEVRVPLTLRRCARPLER